MMSNKNFQRLLRFIPNVLWPLKILLIKHSIKSKGKNFKVGPNVILYNRKEITVGKNVFIGDGTVIGGKVKVQIGDNVMFGPEVMIRGGDHNFSVVGKPMFKVKDGGLNLPIIIENDVWIGTRVIILKGVRIREGSVIGAGAIVTRDTLPYSIFIGTPAKPVKCRFTKKNLEQHLKSVDSAYTVDEIISLYSEKNNLHLLID